MIMFDPFYPFPSCHPYPYRPIFDNPQRLGELAVCLSKKVFNGLQTVREKVKDKGQEHRKLLETWFPK